MKDDNSVLIMDIETRTFGKPDPDKDRLRIFGCYSYKTKKVYLLTNKDDIQRIVSSHRFLVGFNNDYYDNPILKREGIDLKYKSIIDLRKIILNRAASIKTKKGLLNNLLMSYSLDFITKTLGLVDEDTGKKKIDYRMFMKEHWTADEKAEIAKYTKQDIIVTKKLYEWCEDYFAPFKEFLRPEDVNRKYYLTLGIAKFAYKAICKAMGWKEDYGEITGKEKRISGGYVAYPAGERFEGNIYCLDFASLYPHIMIQCNLYGRKKEGVIDDRPIWTGGNKWKVEGVYYADELNDVGKLLKKWYADRVKYKQQGDRREYTIKISLNTIYGLLDNAYYKLVYDSIAGGDCTRIGRQWTKYARKKFREGGYKVCYTDSVGKDSLIRTNKGNYTIKELFKKGRKINHHNKWHLDKKERCNINGYKVLSLDDNYNVVYDKVKQIIRHKTKKKIYKLYLNSYEHIIVTEDHSLIWFDDEGKLVEKKPKELKNIIGLKNIPYCDNRSFVKNVIGEYNPFLSKEMLLLIGFFYGDGGIQKSNNNSIGISAGLDVQEFIEKIVKPLNLRYHIQKNKFDIIIMNKTLREYFVNNNIKGTSKTKVIPEFIFNLSEEQIGYFLSGFCSADGMCNKQGSIECGCTNEKLVLQLRELFYRIGIQTTMKRDFEPNNFNGVVAKIPTYNFWLKISNHQIFKEKVGFIFDRKNNNIPKHKENKKYFAPKKIREKTRKLNNSNYKGELVNEQTNPNFIDVPVRRIQKIEEIEYNNYVYDIETEKTHRFFANDILVHNTDSVYIVDPHNNKERMLEVVKEIINDIKATVPFSQDTFDMDIDDEIKYMFFFKGKVADKETDREMDDDDFINKPLNLIKKNYVYVTKDGDVKYKNLGIKKKSNSPLSRKIFNEFLMPKIKEGQIKFSKTFLRNLIIKLIEQDIQLATLRKDVGTFQQYAKTSPNSLPAQIARKYGAGLHYLIPNLKGIGVGKGKSYCTVEEYNQHNMNISHININNFLKELDYFIKPVVVRDIFSFEEK